MKKTFKIISIILSIVLLFSSCGKVTPESATEKIKEYLSANNYNDCKNYVETLSASVKSSISADALNLVANEFAEIYESKSQYDVYDLTYISNEFVETCNKLLSIAKEFEPDEKMALNENLIYLRYFSELTDSLRYKEIYKVLKDMYNTGYLDTLTEALTNYENNTENVGFDKAQKIAETFNCSSYNPEEYYITDLRDACEKLNKHLVSVNNGLATNDTTVIASAINGIYDSFDVFLTASKIATSVYNNSNDMLNTFRTDGAFSDYKEATITEEKYDYSINQDFGLSAIFGPSEYSANDDADDSNNDTSNAISKSEAIRLTVNALNKTKAFKGSVTVTREQKIDVQMTSFETTSTVATAVALVKGQINEKLRQSNGTSRGEKTYVNGVSDGLTLNDSIPPAGKSASLDSTLVEEYSAEKGSGGYVVAFTLEPRTSTNENMSTSLLAIVDGFYFDEAGANAVHKSYYGPTVITATINNYGYITQYSYTINGVADCKFFENDEHVASAEFSFSNQYTYNLKF